MRRTDLVSDCGNCAAVCCVATSFEVSDDFACDKAAGERCSNLRADGLCAIHAQLSRRGFSGCAVYECYGAGPRVTRAFEGIANTERLRNETFVQLRVLHELLWLVTEAVELCPPSQADLRAELVRESAALDQLASGPVDSLRELNLRPQHEKTHRLLRRVGTALGGRRALCVLGP
jgi:hypothetical protein